MVRAKNSENKKGETMTIEAALEKSQSKKQRARQQLVDRVLHLWYVIQNYDFAKTDAATGNTYYLSIQPLPVGTGRAMIALGLLDTSQDTFSESDIETAFGFEVLRRVFQFSSKPNQLLEQLLTCYHNLPSPEFRPAEIRYCCRLKAVIFTVTADHQLANIKTYQSSSKAEADFALIDGEVVKPHRWFIDDEPDCKYSLELLTQTYTKLKEKFANDDNNTETDTQSLERLYGLSVAFTRALIIKQLATEEEIALAEALRQLASATEVPAPDEQQKLLTNISQHLNNVFITDQTEQSGKFVNMEEVVDRYLRGKIDGYDFDHYDYFAAGLAFSVYVFGM